jgi:thiamine-monophosphate kinase
MTARSPANREFAIIDRLARRLPGPPAGEIWIGDDAAVLTPTGGRLLLSTDMTVAGVHADLTLVDVEDLGWRAVACALSDIAAMGGRARHLVIAAAGPPSTDMDRLGDGMIAAAAFHECAIVGGDLSLAPEVVVAVTVVGEIGEDPGPVLRGGARRGDLLFVTGSLGAAAAGLRLLRSRAGGEGHEMPTATDPTAVDVAAVDVAAVDAAAIDAYRRPVARLAEGESARRAGATAMIDVSDGFAVDLGHVAESSGVGFSLDQLPIASGASVDEALGGGDDYELVFAAPDPGRVAAAFDGAGLRSPTVIGRCTADPNQREWAGTPVAPQGWEHRWA